MVDCNLIITGYKYNDHAKGTIDYTVTKIDRER